MMHVLSDEAARSYLDIGITAVEVVRLLNPDASDFEAAHLLWEHTPFPLVSGIHDLADRLPGLECDCEEMWHETRQPLDNPSSV